MPLSCTQRLVFEMFRDEALARVRDAKQNWVYYNVSFERLQVQSDIAHSIMCFHENDAASYATGGDDLLNGISDGLRCFPLESPLRAVLNKVLNGGDQLRDHIRQAYDMFLSYQSEHAQEYDRIEARINNIKQMDFHEDMRTVSNMTILLHQPFVWTPTREYLTPARLQIIHDLFVAEDVVDVAHQNALTNVAQRTESDEEYDRMAAAIDIT